MKWAWALVAAMCCTALPAQARRVALLVGNDAGSAEELPLQHTGDDVRRLASTLMDLGHFSADDIDTAINLTAGKVLSKLDGLLARDDIDLLFVYYSGHADGSALHLNNTRLRVDDLLERLRRARSKLQLLVLDACQSGAANRIKGMKQGPPFDVQQLDDLPAGQIVITSSAADERSYESDMHQGALFTNHWIAGLRGAADVNADGQVTLGEAYNYTYAQTLRDTLLLGGGPQHPTFRWGFGGQREPVLTFLQPDAWLTLRSSDDGAFVVFTQDEQDVIIELSLAAGQQVRLALTAGDYVVKKRDTSALHAAAVHLDRGDDRVLYDRQMRQIPFVQLAQKGNWGAWHAAAAAGQYASGMGPKGPFYLALGADVERATWLYAMRVLLSLGSENRNGLRTEDNVAGLQGTALWLHGVGPLTMGVGPLVGVLYVQQQSRGHAPQGSVTGLLGGRVALTAPLLGWFSIAVTADAAVQTVRTMDPAPTWGGKLREIAFVPWLAYGLEMRFFF